MPRSTKHWLAMLACGVLSSTALAQGNAFDPAPARGPREGSTWHFIKSNRDRSAAAHGTGATGEGGVPACAPIQGFPDARRIGRAVGAGRLAGGVLPESCCRPQGGGARSLGAGRAAQACQESPQMNCRPLT